MGEPTFVKPECLHFIYQARLHSVKETMAVTQERENQVGYKALNNTEISLSSILSSDLMNTRNNFCRNSLLKKSHNFSDEGTKLSKEETPSTSFDNDSEDLNTKQHCMVGKQYQASIPPLVPYQKNHKKSKCLWKPNDKMMSSLELQSFLENVNQMNGGFYCKSTDNEQALYKLHQCNYNPALAYRLLQIEHEKSVSNNKWTEDEMNSFETGLRLHGKDFYKIRNQFLKSKTTKQIIEFYYLWKKTERGENFYSRINNTKSKYSIQPGTTCLMDIFFKSYQKGDAIID